MAGLDVAHIHNRPLLDRDATRVLLVHEDQKGLRGCHIVQLTFVRGHTGGVEMGEVRIRDWPLNS